jgi:hypothetical protein
VGQQCRSQSVVVLSKLIVAAGAVEEVGIPTLLRDFQVRWESPALGLFLGAASSTDPFIRHFRFRAKLFDTKLSRYLSQTR